MELGLGDPSALNSAAFVPLHISNVHLLLLSDLRCPLAEHVMTLVAEFGPLHDFVLAGVCVSFRPNIHVSEARFWF
jgi:hypothetical protein